MLVDHNRIVSPRATRSAVAPVTSLFAMLEAAAAHEAEAATSAATARGIYVLDERGAREFRTYAQLLEGSLRVGAALRSHDVGSGERIFLVQRTGFDFLTSFFGALAVGAQPIPLPLPREEQGGNVISTGARWARLGRRLDARVALCSSRVDQALRPRVLPAASPFRLVADLPTLLEKTPAGAAIDPVQVAPDDVAYVQLTSGTTTARRGVMLSHHNILQNVDSVGRHLRVDAHDVVVSWLPMYNIMGLVAVVFFSMYGGLDCVLIDPERFLKRPEEWFWAIARHRGTLSLAPNFAYHYCVRRCKESDLEGLDLSSWRVTLNGSEPVRAQHMEAFVRRFRRYGLDERVFMPVYGLSEATLAVTCAGPGESLVIDGINRRVLEREARAEPLPPEGAPCPSERMHLVSVGRPLDDIELRIVDDDGNSLPERVCGEIALRGASVMKGYVASTINTEDARPGLTRLVNGWLYTGDVGYLADGHLYFIGRRSERIVSASGRHLYPEEIELFVNAIDGVRSGTATVFAVPRSTTERSEQAADGPALVIAFETQSGVDLDEIDAPMRALLLRHLDLVPDILVSLSPRSVPRTRSGKVRRFLARQLYLDGKLERRERSQFDMLTAVRRLRQARRLLLGGDALDAGRSLLERFVRGGGRTPD